MNVGEGLGFPRPGVNRFTFEGQLEAWGDFVGGATRATGWRRVLAKSVLLLILLSMVLGFLLAALA